MHQPDRKEERWGGGSGLQLIGKCTTVEKSCTVKSANVLQYVMEKSCTVKSANVQY